MRALVFWRISNINFFERPPLLLWIYIGLTFLFRWSVGRATNEICIYKSFRDFLIFFYHSLHFFHYDKSNDDLLYAHIVCLSIYHGKIKYSVFFVLSSQWLKLASFRMQSPFLLAKLLYNYKCPSLCPSVRFRGKAIFSAAN